MSPPALGRLQPQRMSQAHDVRRDRAALRVVLRHLDERAIDLDDVDGEALELGERGDAGAKVVDRDTHALVVQSL